MEIKSFNSRRRIELGMFVFPLRSCKRRCFSPLRYWALWSNYLSFAYMYHHCNRCSWSHIILLSNRVEPVSSVRGDSHYSKRITDKDCFQRDTEDTWYQRVTITRSVAQMFHDTIVTMLSLKIQSIYPIRYPFLISKSKTFFKSNYYKKKKRCECIRITSTYQNV